ncbi:hypothetical protein Glove_52g50 [Diversispora epigaea]|uniref:TLDc domain-containing protein n=1 Tax=Diversispora epigaea TaxID=1348612 RepID=A0A397JGP2_9GLOM|nr:hypothetical protein Glove_52g50 [Diversispora epigaea]
MSHGHADTIVVAKVAGTDEIVGGYNPLAWNNSARGVYEDIVEMETNDSFIFSLKNGNIRNSIISRVKDQSKALFYYKSFHQYNNGPCFGRDFVMESDVADFTQDKSCWCDYGTYEKPIRTTTERFSIVDYEVFKVIKNKIKIIPLDNIISLFK